uniref:Cilia- and flagella-associated protein 251 n=1 Tax=Canis lupus familiaris TaxID=9615 RepID=A0A8I3PRY5_CANLF
MVKISLKESPQKIMSDAGEHPLEETEEDGETEMEEDYNYRGMESMQQELKDDILVWREPQQEGEQEEEGEEEGEEKEGVEEEGEEGEEWEKERGEEEGEEEGEEGEEGEEEGEEAEEWEKEKGEVEGKEVEEGENEGEVGEEGEEWEKRGKEEVEEEGEEEEEEQGEEGEEEEEKWEKEGKKEGEEWEKEGEEEEGGKEEEEGEGQEEEGEEAGEQGEEEEGEEREEEEEKEEEEEGKEYGKEEEAAGVQEETTVKLREITKSMVNLERLTSTRSQSIMSGTFLPSSEPTEKIDQMPQDELGQERRDLEPGKEEERLSSLSEEEEKEFQPKAEIPESSLVSTSEDILFQKDYSANVYPLTMTWSFGWNSSLPVYYIRDENQRVLLYVCAHTAVIYNVFKNTQHHLQGHLNVISCLCISEDRRWIATADKGPNCLIIIWDSFTGIPVHTIFDSCPEGNGIGSIAITRDAKYLATISDAEIQKVCIWRWTLAVETPACTLDLPKEYGFQNYLTFNPTNNKELVSNSKTQAIYYVWYEERDILAHSAPRLTEKTFNKLVGKFSQTVFHLNLTQILSATMEGKLVVWDIHRPSSSASTSVGFPQIKPCKLVHLQKEGITVLTTVDRNFIIGTSDATVYHLTTDGTKLEKLFVEPKDAICAISCHPYQPLIAIGSFCGMIKVWDYEKKKYLFSRVFEKGLGVQSLTYNPEGVLLGAGFTEGTVYILDAMSLENQIPEPFKYSRTNVTHISFSHDSQYMATADVHFTVAVYKVIVKNGHRVWEYLARLRSHRKSIRSLLFGVQLDSNEPRLLSLGKDRLLIEYNLLRSRKDNLEVLDIHRTDQGNYPTCMVWYPPLTKELFLLVCNSGYKVKLFNSITKMCRKTLLGPVFGSPIEQIQILPVKTTLELQKRYMVFINRDKVGLQILPVDGNPHKTSAIVCHPSGVAGMALSYDGCYAFTAGGQDRSVVQWEVNVSALEAAVSLGGEDLTPFYGLVAGGREGKFYRELEDYFYYSQLRSQGIDTMETRKVSEHICLSELPFVMRAIGFYPSEEKIEDMFNEIRFSEYVDTGKLIDKINLPDFFKVYLNHRPPFGNTMSGIQHSFDILGFTNSKGKKVIRREDFLKLLLTKGEHMTEEEMRDCFATLFGLNPEGWKSEPAASSVKGSEICFEEELPDEITAEIFTTDILGLTISQDFRQDPTVSEVVKNV